LKTKNDITSRYYEYGAFKEDLTRILSDNPDVGQRRIVANNYQIPSMVNLYQNPAREAICLSVGYHETLYSFHYPTESLVGENFLVISEGTKFPGALRSRFEEYSPLGALESKRRGKTVRMHSLWKANNYFGKE